MQQAYGIVSYTQSADKKGYEIFRFAVIFNNNTVDLTTFGGNYRNSHEMIETCLKIAKANNFQIEGVPLAETILYNIWFVDMNNGKINRFLYR